MPFPNLAEIDQARRSGFRPGVVGCFLNDKKILFLFKEKHNLWQLPQGGIDNKESIEQATRREMREELGKKFTTSMKIHSLIGQNQVEFPDNNKNSRDLVIDAGKKIFMQGKKYFFIAIDIKIPNLNIKETEFDDYSWLDYADALILAKTIYQQGKQRVTLDALKSLHELDLL